MMMTPSPLLTTPTSKPAQPSPLITLPKPNPQILASSSPIPRPPTRRQLAASIARGVLACSAALLLPAAPSVASSDEEYVKETSEVINKVRSTINMDKANPEVPAAVEELRDASNMWVAKYRREKSLLGRPSFRDMYSALNAVSGHYISFGPTAPIPSKRKARILEEVDTAEKALLRGR